MSAAERAQRRADVRLALEEPKLWVLAVVLGLACEVVAWGVLQGSIAHFIASGGPPFFFAGVLDREANAVRRRRQAGRDAES